MQRRKLLALCLMAGLPHQAQASDWTYTASIFGWFTGLESEVDTDFGTVGTELDFNDVWEQLDMAFFGTFESTNGPWTLVTDLVYADLSSDVGTPFGVAFRRAEVDTRMALVSAYAAYAVVDQPGVRVDVGPGFRYNDLSIETKLVGNKLPTRTLSYDDSWVDPLLAARVRFDIGENWFGSVFADIGGFGVGDAADTTWQVFAGVGYEINETWAVRAGYRALGFERDFDGNDVSLELGGPMIGFQVAF